MGRFQGLHEEPLMSAAEVASYLIETCVSLAAFKAYMFGSYVNSLGTDVDILVVGEASAKMTALKQEIVKAGERLPLHVLYMNPREVQETDFLDQQKCVPLIQIAAGGYSSQEVDE